VTGRRAAPLVVLVVGLVAVELATGLWFDHLERRAGRPDLVGFRGPVLVLLVGVLAATVVGAVIAVHRPGHPVGWLFLALGAAMMLAGPVDGYATYGLLGSPGSLPAADVAALVADQEWIPWLVLTSLVLHLTPDGHFLSPRWRLAGLATVVSGGLTMALSVLSRQPFESPFQSVPNPFGVAAVQPAADVLRTCAVYVMGCGLIASAVSLVVRFRRSRGDERRRLLWLVYVVVPAPLFVVLAYAGSRADQDVLTILGTSGFVTLVPVAAGLSVLRYRLYDVERIVAATATWTASSLLLVGVYAAVVWLAARAAPSGPMPPAVSAALGALTAVAVAAPARRGLQDALDRQFNRRAHEARRVVAAALSAEVAGVDVESVLRRALADPALTVAYPGAAGTWVTATGEPVVTAVHVDVDRHGRVVARIAFDPDRTSAEAVRRVAELAAAELDNTRLRAELAHQLAEVHASRRRLARAQRRERRRIERDLHDGAQQRLLGLAFQLQSARLNGEPDRMRQALAQGAEQAREAVRDLRALANGLHPAALEDGGLAAALDDMARHSPVPVQLTVSVGRLDRGLEFTAWSVIGEAVVNAQKHAAASAIRVDVHRQDGRLHLRVDDDGRGGANPDGPGLRGLRDRVETVRGVLTVESAPGGTAIEAVLPCGS
jgi:signal transduction histidine kinase